jgi:hypothetical protein
LSNFVRRAAFALRFGSLDPLISSQIDSDTKLLMERDVRSRATKLAPFLDFDADPYPVVLGDRTIWILDGYTTSDMYPYAQALSGEGSLTGSFNYVRNSVKVTVDAYEGTVTFYVIDEKDPVIKAWRAAFPDLFTDGSEMPDEVRAHLRYPEDLVKSQGAMFGRYHVTEPKRFYDGSAKWLVSPDPGSGAIGSDILSTLDTGTSSASTGTPQAATSTGKRIDPYYLYIRLPGEAQESFTVLQPFVPGRRQQPDAPSFRSSPPTDPEHYGRLRPTRCRRARRRPGAGEQRHSPRAGDLVRDHVAQPAGLERHPGEQLSRGDTLVYVRPFYTQGRAAVRIRCSTCGRRAGQGRVLRTHGGRRPEADARPEHVDHDVQRRARQHVGRYRHGLADHHHDPADDHTHHPVHHGAAGDGQLGRLHQPGGHCVPAGTGCAESRRLHPVRGAHPAGRPVRAAGPAGPGPGQVTELASLTGVRDGFWTQVRLWRLGLEIAPGIVTIDVVEIPPPSMSKPRTSKPPVSQAR